MTTSTAMAGSGPIAAKAIGRARTSVATVSVNVSEYAVQKGGILSRRLAIPVQAQLTRSRRPSRSA